jgi:hypothetical protein
VQRFFPPLKIHTWGGLGSQLFAVAICTDLRRRFPRRSIQIVLHTGGVTRRVPEVVELFSDFRYIYQEDFGSLANSTESKPKSRNTDIRTHLKNILLRIGFIAHCSDDFSTDKLRPWVLSLRGHYSYRSISPDFLADLKKSILNKEFATPVANESSCCIHYRLGDLLTLSEKKPISSLSVLSEFKTIQKLYDFSKLIVFSDSPIEAKQRFSTAGTQLLEVPNSSTTQVIANSVHAKYFIGTSSKISFWIAAIRAVVDQGRSSLPGINVDQFKGLVRGHTELINLYETDLE